MLTDEKEVMGDDLIATPGHNLNPQELRLVLGLAEGTPPQQIAQALGTTVPALRDIENSASHKLTARSRGNLIARAFQLGVLQFRRFTVIGALTLGVAALAYLYLHNTRSALSHYDSWAGGSRGPATQDPRYNGKHIGTM